ncbi:MAG: beta-phosphoglucomutase family hydrolase [Bacteroidales bacterium]|nr:beta-phosphoglucomutase family hydrolase [Bacteroidales bacterium]
MHKHLFKAVIFDLDGVITQTAKIHSSAWKRMFDEFLQDYSQNHPIPFRPFSHEEDYLPFVDGKPRYKGVASFLESRNIKLPYGTPEDTDDMHTVCGLGNKKNTRFNEIVTTRGVDVFPSSVALLKRLKKENIHIAVATSSKNCDAILKATGLQSYFEVQVDGAYSATHGLKGKPDADIFTTAADQLGVPYDQAVVVEDAVSGVMAGKKGNFGLVIGVARENNALELEMNGADLVVEDLEALTLDMIDRWFEEDLPEDGWQFLNKTYQPLKEKSKETLFTTGNGYFATRGCMEECEACDFHYPGTYVARLYNRITSRIADKEIENEDFVNVPNWLSTTFKINNGPWFNPETWKINYFRRNLELASGELTRDMLVTDPEGRTLLIEAARFVSMKNKHLAGLMYCITPMNFEGRITLKSGINGDIINSGVERYRDLNQRHLQPDREQIDGDAMLVQVKTTQSKIGIAVAARFPGNMPHRTESRNGQTYAYWDIYLQQDETFKLEKMVSLYTSLENNNDFAAAAMHTIKETESYYRHAAESLTAWSEIWEMADIRLEGDREAQRLIRLHIYHLLCAFSPHNQSLDASITARGLHGEAYRGHIFWDELFILPWYCKTFPEAAKAMLMYRYNRLDKARAYAASKGLKGAMYPWQSGSDGREETQTVHLNPVSGKWGEDFSALQRHVSLAIAYNIYTYYHLTGDKEFMDKYGLEMLEEIARFWISKAELKNNGRYSIEEVMGPDEFHEKNPGSEKAGLKDNAYTNLMVAWLLRTIDELTGTTHKPSIISALNLVLSDDGILSQFDGYFNLKELDWEDYRKKYGDIHRMDRILKSEGLNPDDYKVAKQADTLMIFYNLNNETVTALLQEMGYQVPSGYIADNLDYYLQRTSHGSTLSRVVHAYLARVIGQDDLSWELFQEALQSDANDIQGGTTAEGIHAGVMAGTLEIVQKAFAGLDLRGNTIIFNPKMPKHWRRMTFRFRFRGERFEADIQNGKTSLTKLYSN